MAIIREIFGLIVLAIAIPFMPLFWGIGIIVGVIVRAFFAGFVWVDTLYGKDEEKDATEE